MNDVGPEITVLIPIFNVERYLAKCLESVRSQTFANFEAICINDGSTDRSREIIGAFLGDSRFRVIDKPNSGYGASMNRGLDAARGRYVAIVESDDYIEPNALEAMHAAAETCEAEVVKADFFFYWSQPHERNEKFGLIKPRMANRIVNPQQETEIFYLKPSIWSALYLTSFLRKNDIRFLETPGASYQDAGFNFKVWASAIKAVYLPEAYLHYRQDNETSSVNSPGKVYCVCDEYQEMDRYLDARPEKKAYLKPVEMKMKYDSYMWNYERLSAEFQMEFLERMSREFKEHMAEGLVDLDLFEPWKILDLQMILKSPKRYHMHRVSSGGVGGFSKAIHYLRIGGLPLALKIAKRKYFAKEQEDA
ncbi:glycosyltransferase family 2 protein [Gordonibacter urolithinfaciens]|uniref:glycosyltransferase family 2 protein n=1 Tax=Gordonibacter urolithinfaciens TaxID=1335613 RepID=UPI003A94A7DB